MKGGIRTPSDFIKALCLGADGVTLLNSAIQAEGCSSARICNTNNCPTRVATHQGHLRARLNADLSTQRLARLLGTSVELMKMVVHACEHTHLDQFEVGDITTWKKEMADLTEIQFAGVGGAG